MAKSVHTDVLDGALNVIKNNADKMVLCSQQPLTFTEANTTYALADVAMVSGDYTLAAGDVSGRKATVAAKATVPVDANGTGNHVALVDTVNSKLLYVTTCTAQAVAAGNNVNFPAWDIEFADPA